MWQITMTKTFDNWFSTLGERDRASVLAALMVLREKGPGLPRPWADTVKGSRYSNMKELRIQSRGDPLRVFFAFDPQRVGILLCAGSKAGHEKRFYDVMIPTADREFRHHLHTINNRE
ncbi:type II toxin-antitoxin system RelE/ParE family toxin [Kosakonia oryzendophytica]|uniref:type II toxin-antitoxin system RelE/ParE family toxin n=1 Tax=Kosakonia oryzendophytica TaxID=1005665 RepID=UPI003D34B86E